MKVGAENQTKTIIAGVLMVLAAILVVRMFMQSPTPAAQTTTTTTTQPNRRARTGRRQPRGTPTVPVLTASLDPTVRLDLLNLSEKTNYEGTGRNIFREEAEPIPQIVTPPIKKNEPPPGPPPPPPPPPINLKFFGIANRPGEPKKALLGQGDAVFIAAEGDIVNNRYKVVHIGVNSVEIQDVLNNNTQTIPLTQG